MNTLSKSILLSLLFLLPSSLAFSNTASNEISVVTHYVSDAFPLVHKGAAAPIYIDMADATVAQIAGEAFQKDIERVTSILPPLKNEQDPLGEYAVILGTLGQSKLIAQLVDAGKIERDAIVGKWETFTIAIVEAPLEGVEKALVIMGSDPRGTAFGVFELSKLIGVSPWYWWADAPIQHQENLYILAGQRTSGPPSVKYRGMFLNDEDWGLQPWAAQNIDTAVQDIGPNTYVKIFELLLRLKANLIWPAMHPSTKAFFHYPENPPMAHAYSIVVGTSHAEPMLRNNVDEWNEKSMGKFDYVINGPTIYNYWEKRAKESKDIEAIYTMGIRGVHDSGMQGVKNAGEAAEVLEKVIADQRKILREQINQDISSIPQAFTAYKEVLDIYDHGLELPEDITLVWPDDNYGYIKRLSNAQEQLRSGGADVYYHASYWGRPHDYLWLSTTHPALIREEMWKAYQMEAKELWVLNVGDIKPLEYDISLFFDMAYDMTPFDDSGYAKIHHLEWIDAIFGGEAEAIEAVLWEYYDLAFERKPEFMGWSRTEPTTSTTLTAYNHFYYGDEAQNRINRYQALEDKVRKIRQKIKPEGDAAFYQLVYYPIVGASLMNKKFLFRDKSVYYTQQNRASASDYALMARQAYDNIVKETDYYNNQLSGGKWKGVMSMKPRNLPVFHPVGPSSIEIQTRPLLGAIPEGFVHQDSALFHIPKKELFLSEFSPLGQKKQFVDIFLQDDKALRWKVSTSDPWIQVAEKKGTLKPAFGQKEKRIWVSIHWDKVPQGKSLKGHITIKGNGGSINVEVSAINPLLTHWEDGNFVEHNGYISIFAENFTEKQDKQEATWNLIDGLGHTGRSLMALPFKAKSMEEPETIRDKSPFVAYDFYLLKDAVPTVNVFCLPTHPVTSLQQMRFAITIDDGPLQLMDFQTFGRSEEWKENVLRNSAVSQLNFPELKKGKHNLKIYMMDPGVILDRIVIDLGGLQEAYSTIPETRYHNE